VTIPAGASSTTITITPIADNIAEGDETVTLTIASDLAYGLAGTGSATVTIKDLPIDAWRFSHFNAAELSNPAISGDLADADGDSLTNLVEYTFSLDPKVPSEQSLPAPSIDANGYLSVTYAAAPDVTVTVEVSTDLVVWHSGAGYTFAAQANAVAETQTSKVSAVTPANSVPQQFMRFRVSRP
jgi:hypothetical protein